MKNDPLTGCCKQSDMIPERSVKTGPLIYEQYGRISLGLFFLKQKRLNRELPRMQNKKTGKTTYKFKPLHGGSRLVSLDRQLICPECRQELERSDIEGYFACPFCSHVFEQNVELEDFLLQPHVDEWMRQQPGFSFQVLGRSPEFPPDSPF